jgi:hypothetical protein
MRIAITYVFSTITLVLRTNLITLCELIHFSRGIGPLNPCERGQYHRKRHGETDFRIAASQWGALFFDQLRRLNAPRLPLRGGTSSLQYSVDSF